MWNSEHGSIRNNQTSTGIPALAVNKLHFYFIYWFISNIQTIDLNSDFHVLHNKCKLFKKYSPGVEIFKIILFEQQEIDCLISYNLKSELSMTYPKETAPKIIVAGTTFSNHEENSSLEKAVKNIFWCILIFTKKIFQNKPKSLKIYIQIKIILLSIIQRAGLPSLNFFKIIISFNKPASYLFWTWFQSKGYRKLVKKTASLSDTWGTRTPPTKITCWTNSVLLTVSPLKKIFYVIQNHGGKGQKEEHNQQIICIS